MTLLSGWLFRAKKSPWGTSNFASTLKEAGERYLEAVLYKLQEPLCYDVGWITTKAQQDDYLMELFSRDILRERLSCLIRRRNSEV